jgi:hypothetical protein
MCLAAAELASEETIGAGKRTEARKCVADGKRLPLGLAFLSRAANVW